MNSTSNNQHSPLIKVGITQGDHNGVGLEVALKAIAPEGITELFTPVLFADRQLVEKSIKELGIECGPLAYIQKASESKPGQINVVDLHLKDITVERGKPSKISGAGAVESLERATDAVISGDVDVLVTAPISKEAVRSDEFTHTGHTEYLSFRAGEAYKAQMILFDDILRVALVTTHLPISQLSGAITREGVAESIKGFSSTLTKDFSVTRPKIAVLSLNPHTGDGGLLGSEEIEVIAPAISDCIGEGVLAFGPYPADGFFGSGAYKDFDGVLAMYHDQGLAPFKTLAAERGVNFTAGLPFVRTSPDHGTANDIAWKGEADATSMREAIYKAIDIFRNRKRHEAASANPLKPLSDNTHRNDRRRQSEEKIDTEENIKDEEE